MEKSKKESIVKSVTELVNKLMWDKSQEERTQQIAMLSIDELLKLNKSDVISSVYCQRSIEDEDKCDEQCEHCGEYYKPLEQ